jgi:hypothetical protein
MAGRQKRLSANSCLAVLSDDYMTVPVEKVGELNSVLTLVGGKAVYGEGPFGALEGKL